mmetsp:Transcript_23432/g.41982  ORF Transcript_23432/g.41982 Transcript_23432/m.41982 type:complete len:164 (+) Transcript_23432:158-649(+)|eukprot:CAMPEP_0201899102 /NCGR_PEP_ID=MMETSP0902-20130614/49741_1 /ASSEMBLY_ACC=CAM_ASM_000551 /TAXON_ID=420261 /ORGANISM="Thalassiosira antarctica, Strain CCMP982" /LENGTH=163 /DNA_ID=CAMNT_0048432421 /DNA_START=95 /DNA_END=586 /DNA_ORIENTATION=-
MAFTELRTATLRSVFAGVYVANFIIAILHFGIGYLDILASLIIIILSACMLTITLQQPEQLMVYFETTGKEIIFTWRMRVAADIIQILFLISCGTLGEIMAIVTGVFLFMAFSLAKKRPDIFRELFRKHAGDPMVGDEGVGESDADDDVASRYEEAAEPSVTV